jgi:arginine/lysine/ornithine decarboxylase
MNAPLYHALCAYLEENRERLHMPGHKGALPWPLCEAAPFDVTELPATGSLPDGEGPVLETERMFCEFYGSGATLLSAGGATLCIQAMLALFCPEGSTVLMARQSHAAAVGAAALLGLSPVWLWPDEPSGVQTPGRVSPRAVKTALGEHPDCRAVFLTSPDYFGALCDI